MKLVDHAESRYQHLLADGIEGFDPVRLAVVRTLLDKAKSQRDAVALKACEKALSKLKELETDFEMAEQGAALVADRLEYQFPEHAPEVQALFQSKQFEGLNRLERKLDRTKRNGLRHLEDLAALTKGLSQLAATNEKNDDKGLAGLLEQQELEILADHPESQTPPSQQRELKSIQVLREFQAKQQLEDLIEQALREKPDNPGPINPHMLAIRSLLLMKELSPEYLSHFVSYMDTLFCLETS